MITQAGPVVVTSASSVLFPSSTPEHVALNDDNQKLFRLVSATIRPRLPC
jgi:hypothetical protein